MNEQSVIGAFLHVSSSKTTQDESMKKGEAHDTLKKVDKSLAVSYVDCMLCDEDRFWFMEKQSCYHCNEQKNELKILYYKNRSLEEKKILLLEIKGSYFNVTASCTVYVL